jgi:hypothetical protein
MRMTPWESTPRKLAKSKLSAVSRASPGDRPSFSKQVTQNAKSFPAGTFISFILAQVSLIAGSSTWFKHRMQGEIEPES